MLLFILAVAIGVLIGVVGSRLSAKYGDLARIAAAIAGFIIGFWGTYIVAANVPK